MYYDILYTITNHAVNHVEVIMLPVCAMLSGLRPEVEPELGDSGMTVDRPGDIVHLFTWANSGGVEHSYSSCSRQLHVPAGFAVTVACHTTGIIFTLIRSLLLYYNINTFYESVPTRHYLSS